MTIVTMSTPESETMDVSAQAKRIMVHALGKLYTLRTQRGGLRLHRSLLITLMMKTAREMYHRHQETLEQPEVAEKSANATGLSELTTDTACIVQKAQNMNTSETQTECPEKTRVQKNSQPDQRANVENKENRSLTRPDHCSRKRRGKAAAEPDFIPYKKAKIEEVRRNPLIITATFVNSCRDNESLSHLSIPRTIVTY